MGTGLIDEIREIVLMLYTEPLECMTKEELIKKHEDVMNTFIGVLIGARMTTDRIKSLIETKKNATNSSTSHIKSAK